MSKRDLDQMDLAENNTDSARKREPMGEKWYATVNNWSQDQWDQMDQIFDSCDDIECAVMGKEVGESGTPHLQCYMEFKRRIRPRESGIFKALGTAIHWGDEFGKPCKKKMPRAVGINYCSKDGDFKCYRCKKPRELKLIVPDRDWEVAILDKIKEEPDDRTIHWVWSKKGCMGKSCFSKYLVAKHNACVLHGKGDNVRHGLAQWITDKGEFPDIVVYPIPKCFSAQYLSYEGLEQIKDMFFYSGKYEGGQVCGPNPHVFVFANEPPDKSKMSADRWDIKRIDDDEISESLGDSTTLEGSFRPPGTPVLEESKGGDVQDPDLTHLNY